MSATSNSTLGQNNSKTVAQAAASSIPLDPAALSPAHISVRVTAGAAAAGPRLVTDAGGTPDANTATLSADGATLSFEADVTEAELLYASDSMGTGLG